MVCVKLPKSEMNEDKTTHERKILEQLRNSYSGYLFKYYVSEQADFPFKDNLMIDATRSPTLHEYLCSNFETVSLRTKLFIICQVAQSLSYLKDSQIVHMDLKKSNIMILKDLQVKLFDFTESYHPVVCGKCNFQV